MKVVSALQDLFAHNDWANGRVLELCRQLSDEQLDKPREMGFGTLRNTLFHILEAEKLWLERWQGKPWRALVPDANGATIDSIVAESKSVADQRNQMLEEERSNKYSRIVEFQDSQQNAYAFPLGHLMNHVANHGVHHRAQALSYLKGFEKTIPAGLDYTFYKLAYPSCPQDEASREPMERYGLQFNRGEGNLVEFDVERIRTYFAYSDWAMNRVHQEAGPLDENQLDAELNLGMGTLRKNFQHMIDAERWWVGNWNSSGEKFPSGEDPRSLDAMRDQYAEVSGQRNAFIETLDETTFDRILSVSFGGPASSYRISETLLQLCAHATHHRSQCVNMLRQLGITFSWIDMIVWVRENH